MGSKPYTLGINKPQKFAWAVSKSTLEEYFNILSQLSQAEAYSDRQLTLIDQMKSLPGFPKDFPQHPDDLLQPILAEEVSKPTKIWTPDKAIKGVN
jgi:hypothetical protein